MPRVGFVCPVTDENVKFSCCTHFCKNQCMSLPMVMAFIGDPRELIENRYSVTEILKPPQAVYLYRHNDIYSSPSKLIYAFWGTGVHALLEEQKERCCWDDRFEFEQHYETIINGITLSGTIDLFDKQTKTIYDYKFTKEYAVRKMLDGKWDESTYADQANIYKCYFKPLAERIVIEAMIKDWTPSGEIYPIQDIDVPIASEEYIRKKTEALLAEHKLNEIDPSNIKPCSKEDVWWNSNPRSKNCNVPLRCAHYCDVSEVCPQYLSFQQATDLGDENERLRIYPSKRESI